MGKDVKPKIDDEFKALCPPLSEHERAMLELSLMTEGLRDSICLWNGVIVDGHNRFELGTKNRVKLHFREMKFADRHEVKNWILRNQLGRRNLGPIQMSYLRGRMYMAARKTGNLSRKSEAKGEQTQDVMARMFGISPGAIRNDVWLTEAIDKLNDEARQYALGSDVILLKQHVIDLAALSSESQSLIMQRIKSGALDGLRAAILRLRPAMKSYEKGPTRCSKCGGKLAVGTMTCLSCDLTDRDVQVRLDSPTAPQELPHGWQDRLEKVREQKKVIGELGGVDLLILHAEKLTEALPKLHLVRSSPMHMALAKLFMALKEKVGKGHGAARFKIERELAESDI